MNFELLPHQLAALSMAQTPAERPEFALFMEQGTGKSLVTALRAERLFREGKIDRMVVVAPNGVHLDWANTHLAVIGERRVEFWISGKKKREAACQALLGAKRSDGLAIVCVNTEALRVRRVTDFCCAFLRGAPGLMVMDESQDISTPSTATFRAACSVGRHARYKMILSGTEVTQGPLDLYAQFQFLRPGMLGFQNFASFKARYAVYEQQTTFRAGNLIKYPKLLFYKNVEELKRKVNEHAFRAQKDELDLPPKIHEPRTVVLGEEQSRIYRRVRDLIVAELEFGTVTMQNALTKILRLSQICGGFSAVDNEDQAVALPQNAVLEAARRELAALPAEQSVIIWARFRKELFALEQMANELRPGKVARYWGGLPSRHAEAEDFKARARTVMIAQLEAAARGHTWLPGTYVIYYSNSFSYETRSQSEDRPHRIGQTSSVFYRDYVPVLDDGSATVAGKTLQALRQKKNMADFFKTPSELL